MDLRTFYLGMMLEHPVVAAASPLSYSLDGIRRLEDGGASAIVLHSLFEEQIERPRPADDDSAGANRAVDAADYFPTEDEYNLTPDAYLELIRSAKEAVDVPVIGSLNGATVSGWTAWAGRIEEAGADALELNLYIVPTDPDEDAAAVESRYFRILNRVKEAVGIPVALKLSPFFSSPANMAMRLGQAGADGLVLFNRFYQPDIDLETGEVRPHLELSRSYDMTLPLRWVAILYGRVASDLAITGGVHGPEDVLKGIMAGAKVTMTASELLVKGPGRVGEIVQGVRDWLDAHGYDSLKAIQGRSSQLKVTDAEAFERANYTRSLQLWARRGKKD